MTHAEAEVADDMEMMALTPNERLKIVEACVATYLELRRNHVSDLRRIRRVAKRAQRKVSGDRRMGHGLSRIPKR